MVRWSTGFVVRCMFNVLPRAGHLNASIALAHELVARGDSVAFFGFERPSAIEERLRRAGLHVPCIGPDPDASAARQPGRHPGARAALTRRLRDEKWRRRFFEYAFVTAIEPQIPAIRRAIRAFAPDVLCNDAMADAGAIAAELEHVPWAALSAMMDLAAPPGFTWPFADSLDEIATQRTAVATSAGVSLRYCVSNVISPLLNVAFFEPLESPPRELPVHFVGPARLAVRGDECPFPWQRLLADRPLVYVSSGTELTWDDRIASDIERAVTSAGAQAVVAPVDDDGEPDREGVIRVSYAPQLQLLERATVVVTHGGTNSVMESLAGGIPLSVIPLDFDQPVTALLVERAGLGASLDPRTWDAARCREVIRRLLEPGAAERARCRAFAARLARCEAARRAADLLHKTLGCATA